MHRRDQSQKGNKAGASRFNLNSCTDHRIITSENLILDSFLPPHLINQNTFNPLHELQ